RNVAAFAVGINTHLTGCWSENDGAGEVQRSIVTAVDVTGGLCVTGANLGSQGIGDMEFRVGKECIGVNVLLIATTAAVNKHVGRGVVAVVDITQHLVFQGATFFVVGTDNPGSQILIAGQADFSDGGFNIGSVVCKVISNQG